MQQTLCHFHDLWKGQFLPSNNVVFVVGVNGMKYMKLKEGSENWMEDLEKKMGLCKSIMIRIVKKMNGLRN